MIQEKNYNDKKIDLRVWKRLISYALRSKWRVIITMSIMVMVATIDLMYPLMTRFAINNLILPQTTQGVWQFALLYLLLVILQSSGVFLFVKGAGRLERDISYDIRQETFTKLQQLSFSFYDTTSVGWLMARMGSDVSRISEMIAWSIIDLMWGGCFALGVMVILLSLNWKLGLLVLTVTPILAILCVIFQRKILVQQRNVRKMNSKITGAFNEGIMGAITTKTLVREDFAKQEFSQLTQEMYDCSTKAARLSALFMPLVFNLGAISVALALWVGGNLTAQQLIDLGTLAAFISYATQLFDPIQQLANILAEMQSAQASAERVLDLMDTTSDITDSPAIVEKYGDLFCGKPENWPAIVGDVEFKNVDFRYKTGEPILQNFNLKVTVGQTIALVGETGAGKSTIINLVCRFYEPSSGSILIDGVDYRERSQLWLQSNLGYVLQSPHLFSGTIAENLRFAKPDATLEEIKRAARLVRADNFIESLPDGYDTQVGEGGGKLSTGQKQLLSLARVLLADPKIFILDEATSSIDTETEAIIQEAIHTVLSGRTSFIVAHRLSTIRNADRILLINKGKIIESGSHQQLMQQKGGYYTLYTHQYQAQATQSILQ